VIVGMTGSGKTGLVTVLVEEVLRARVPVLMIDVKGDLPNLLLAFPSFDPGLVLPWVEGALDPSDDRSPEDLARAIAAERTAGLNAWGITEADVEGADRDQLHQEEMKTVSPEVIEAIEKNLSEFFPPLEGNEIMSEIYRIAKKLQIKQAME